MKSTAYPNFDAGQSPDPVYNLNKWTDAMRNLYVKMYMGASRKDALEAITQGWDKPEKNHFIDWMKYYEGGNQLKYKKAQHQYYVNDDLKFFVPNPQAAPPSPIKSINDQINNVKSDAINVIQHNNSKMTEEDKRKVIEDQRRKLLGRLNSVEKLLSSHQGHLFAGPDFERLLTSIYELKKQIQTINKVSLSMQTCVDLIIRQANILKRDGFDNASTFMHKFAQNTPGDFSFHLGEVPAGGSQPQGGGSLANNTPTNLGAPAPDLDNNRTGKAISEFMENLEGSGITEFDKDKQDVSDIDDEDKDNVIIDDDVFCDEDAPDDKEIVVEAQLAAQPAMVPGAPALKSQEEPKPIAPLPKLEVEKPALDAPVGETNKVEKPTLDVSEDELKRVPETSDSDHIDSLIQSAFGQVTVLDAINKLEQVNKVFVSREIVRQLLVADLLLNQLGISQYFPTLSEVIEKNLSNINYSISRMDDIISRLRGSTGKTMNLDKTPVVPPSPEASLVKQNLEQAEKADEERKQLRKQVQDQKTIEQANKPELEVENLPEELDTSKVQAPTALSQEIPN